MMRFALLTLVLLASPACSSSPEDQCRSLADRICDRMVQCLADGTPATGEQRDSAHQQCESIFYKNVSCSSVTATGPKYDACASQVGSVSCGRIKESAANGSQWLPVACTGGGVFQ